MGRRGLLSELVALGAGRSGMVVMVGWIPGAAPAPALPSLCLSLPTSETPVYLLDGGEENEGTVRKQLELGRVSPGEYGRGWGQRVPGSVLTLP